MIHFAKHYSERGRDYLVMLDDGSSGGPDVVLRTYESDFTCSQCGALVAVTAGGLVFYVEHGHRMPSDHRRRKYAVELVNRSESIDTLAAALLEHLDFKKEGDAWRGRTGLMWSAADFATEPFVAFVLTVLEASPDIQSASLDKRPPPANDWRFSFRRTRAISPMLMASPFAVPPALVEWGEVHESRAEAVIAGAVCAARHGIIPPRGLPLPIEEGQEEPPGARGWL